jgi:hypothetical protein
MTRRWALVGVVAALLLVGVVPDVAAEPKRPPAHVAGLPAPFRSWNVTTEPGTDPHVQWVSFDSAVLHRRATMRVVLPDAYAASRAPLPVAYYLHGTTRIGTDPAVDAVFDGLADAGYAFGYPFSEGNAHDEASFFAKEAHRLQFVVVSPDAAERTWCEHCAWVDGRDGKGVDAETHLYDEVLPLTEAMFRVRSDRAGRGIIGSSMGAGGALIQATRHPDRFAVAAALSPPVDYLYDAPYGGQLLWYLYLRQQGYPAGGVAPIAVRSINPADLFPNLVGEGVDTVITMGDGCVATMGTGRCASAGLVDQPIDAIQEIFIRQNADKVVPQAIAAGVPISYITFEGVHFVPNHEVFDRYLLDRINRRFAAGTPTPSHAVYRSADPTFSIWGWDVAMRRRNQEFVTVDVRPDGRALSITGSGAAAIATPPVFAPGSKHVVSVVREDPGGSHAERSTVTADASGRLLLQVDLGVDHLRDERFAPHRLRPSRRAAIRIDGGG